jgi:hypothetical protein
MQREAAQQGLALKIACGFRPVDDQWRLYTAHEADPAHTALAAYPGTSNHGKDVRTTMDDETTIREFIADRVTAMRTGDAATICGSYMPDAVVFSLAPPLVQPSNGLINAPPTMRHRPASPTADRTGRPFAVDRARRPAPPADPWTAHDHLQAPDRPRIGAQLVEPMGADGPMCQGWWSVAARREPSMWNGLRCVRGRSVMSRRCVAGRGWSGTTG